jgi:hypothetical protein
VLQLMLSRCLRIIAQPRLRRNVDPDAAGSTAKSCISRQDVLSCPLTFIQARDRPLAKAAEEWGNDMQATAAGTELLREEETDGSAHAAVTPTRLNRPRRH